jgi:hypothetical protein
VVTWGDGDYNSLGSGTLGDNSGASIKAQVFAADGAKIGTEFLVNASTYGHQIDPQIAALSNGGFVVSWSDMGGDVSGTAYAIRAQVFAADGTKIGEEALVDIDNQANSAITTALSNGTFVVSRSTYSFSMALNSERLPSHRGAGNGPSPNHSKTITRSPGKNFASLTAALTSPPGRRQTTNNSLGRRRCAYQLG